MATEIIENVRRKYPEYESLNDDDLTYAIGRKYPQYLSSEEFKTDFDRVSSNLNPPTETESAGAAPEPQPAYQQHFDALPEVSGVKSSLQAGEALTQKYLTARDMLSNWAPEKIPQLQADYEKSLKGLGFNAVGDTDANLSKPIINVPEMQGDTVTAGVERAIAKTVSGLTSPESIALMAAGSAFPNLAKAVFGAMAVNGAATDLGTAAGTQGKGAIAEAAASGLINSAFAGALILPGAETVPVAKIASETAKKAEISGAPLTAEAVKATTDQALSQADLKGVDVSKDLSGPPEPEAIPPKVEAQTKGVEPDETKTVSQENVGNEVATAPEGEPVTIEDARPETVGPLKPEEYEMVRRVVQSQKAEPEAFDRFIYAVLAAKKLEAMGVSEAEIARGVMERARNISGSQGDMDFSVSKSAGELREFFDFLNIKPKSGEIPAKSSPKQIENRRADQTEVAGEEAVAEPEPIGVGSQKLNEPADQTSIEALTDAFKGIHGEDIPFSEKVKKAFDMGEKIDAAKDVVGSAVDALKASGNYLVDVWKGKTEIDDIQRTKGELSSELNSSAWRMKKFVEQVRKAMPDVKTREALAKWVDAGGDEASLRDSLAKVPDASKPAYERALKLTKEEKIAAQNIQNFFEARLQEAIDAGVVNEGIGDYIHRIYKKDTDWKKGALASVQAGIIDTKTPGLARKRFFTLDSEAEAAGYKVISDFLPRIVDYEASLSKVIASRAAVKAFSKIKMDDGRPMVDVGGVSLPVPKDVKPREATMINPSFKPGDTKNPKNNRKDFVAREYPALKKWKWVDKGVDGEPVFLQGDVLIHPDAVKTVDALLKPSAIRASKVGRGALAASSAFKSTMLDLSFFHQVQEAIHGAEHGVIPGMELKDIDLHNPDVQTLLKGGVTIGSDASGGLSEGLVGKSLTQMVPGLGPLVKTYHEWLFQDYIPRLKMTMALKALARNRERFSGKMTDEAINHLTAKEANAAFGGINYILEGRSKTMQDAARIIMLAPDFLEARAKFVGQAFTKHGTEQRMALLLGALTMYVTARIANYAVSGQMHNEPENMFSVVVNGKSYGLRTVQGDLLHVATKPFNFMLHRLNPLLARPVIESLTGRDEFGRKRTPWQVLVDTVSNLKPISIRSSREKSIWESLYNSFGISEHRFSDTDQIFKLAQKWKEKNGVQERGEFIYDRDKDPLRDLKIALSQNDEAGSAAEIRKLLDSHVSSREQMVRYFTRYATMPFTGSARNDAKFKADLSVDEKKTLDAAKQHKADITRLFFKSLNRM